VGERVGAAGHDFQSGPAFSREARCTRRWVQWLATAVPGQHRRRAQVRGHLVARLLTVAVTEAVHAPPSPSSRAARVTVDYSRPARRRAPGEGHHGDLRRWWRAAGRRSAEGAGHSGSSGRVSRPEAVEDRPGGGEDVPRVGSRCCSPAGAWGSSAPARARPRSASGCRSAPG
jgi:hypothetical protein